MKTRICFLLALALLPVLAAAQGSGLPKPRSVQVGARAAFSLSHVAGDGIAPGAEYRIQAGGSLGVVTVIPLAAPFSAEIGLLYSAKGYMSEFTMSAPSDTFHYEAKGRFNYFDLPVLLRYNFDAGVRNVSLVAGPQLSRYLRRTEKLYSEDDKGYRRRQITQTDKAGMRSYTLGFVAGIEYRVALSQIGLRLVHDLTAFTKADREYFAAGLRHRKLQLDITFFIGKTGLAPIDRMEAF